MTRAVDPPIPAAGSVSARGSAERAGDLRAPIVWELAEEVPVAFVYNTEPHAVMMATPADLEDFALGFTVGEEIVDGPDAFLLAKVEREGPGYRLCIAVDPDRPGPGAGAGRALEGRSGCGLCGVTDIMEAARAPRALPGSDRPLPETAAILRAFAALPDHQPMNRRNRSLHAAAFCDREGRILLCREDVGRHNALDKAIGALLRAGMDPADGFVAMSSRCSFELARKAAAAGIPLLATVSAPTALAVDVAERAGLTLAALARPDGVVMFNGERDG